jgi:transcription elongation factor Elf1
MLRNSYGRLFKRRRIRTALEVNPRLEIMSPRKSPEGKVAKWAYTMYKRQAKQLIFGPFLCPSCAKNLLNIRVDKKNKKVTAFCKCGLGTLLEYFSSFEPIDYYNKLLDRKRGTYSQR